MMGWAFVGCVSLSILCWFVVSWVDHYLFTYLGDDDDGKHLFMYHTLTIPAHIVAFAIAVATIYVTFAAWFAFITNFVI